MMELKVSYQSSPLPHPDDHEGSMATDESDTLTLTLTLLPQNTILAYHRPLSAITSRNAPPVGHRPNDFSLYPFLNALPDPLEWNVRMAVGTKSTFRVRRVASWSAKSTKELEHSRERLGAARPILLKDAEGAEGREADGAEQVEMEKSTGLKGALARLIDHARESNMGLTQKPNIDVSAT
jgi:hypothetical protein